MHVLRSLTAVLLLAALLPTSTARAAERHWTPLGPPGGSVTALTIAPANRRTLYAGTGFGDVFRSTDAGAHWQRAESRLRFDRINALAVDPGDPLRVYAAIQFVRDSQGGVVVSADGGATWTSGTGLESLSARDVAVSPVDPSFVVAATERGLFESHDRGESWRQVLTLEAHSGLIEVRFAANGDLWVLSQLAGLFLSRDGAISWENPHAGIPEGSFYSSFALDPAAPATLYALLITGDVYRSTDGGATWARRGAPGAHIESALAVSPDSAVLYAALQDGVHRSLDGGLTWQPAPAAFAGVAAQVLAVPPGPPGVVYAGSADRGVLKSADQGATWKPANLGLTARFVRDLKIAPSNPAILYASVQGLGLVTSRDRGASWLRGSAALRSPIGQLAVHPRDPRIAWGGDADGRIAKTRDGGATWTVREIPGGRCMSTTSLVVDPRDPNRLEIAGFVSFTCEAELTSSCLAFLSTDGGATWRCNERKNTRFVDVVFDPVHARTLYASGERGVSKTTADGPPWSTASQGLPPGTTFPLIATTTGVLYVGTPTGVYVSRNGARTWQRASQGIPAGDGISLLAVAPSNPAVLYASTARLDADLGTSFFHLYTSTNGGATWSPLPEGPLPEGAFSALAVDPRRPATLYVGTKAGVYRLE
jgi:photosystem II stability/assembly factor-like uncharacterized protein